MGLEADQTLVGQDLEIKLAHTVIPIHFLLLKDNFDFVDTLFLLL